MFAACQTMPNLAFCQRPQEITLVSNQGNTVFFGRKIGGPANAFIFGRQTGRDARPGADGMVRLGQGKFVQITVHKLGVYEIVARPENYRERRMTLAPPLGRRLGFTFEISDRLDRATASTGRSGRQSSAAASSGAPRVTIEAPSTASGGSIVIVLSGGAPSGVDSFEITVNGQPLALARGTELTRGLEFSVPQRVELTPGLNTVHVTVRDKNGKIAHDTARIERKVAALPANAAPSGVTPARNAASFKPRYRKRVAAVIGINSYSKWPGLEGATGDAQRMGQALKRKGFEVLSLYDRAATREGILRLLGEDLPSRAGREDLVVIFFAGHGQTETLPNGEQRGYIIPVDGDTERVFSTAISMATLRDLRNRMPAKHVYYVMDSCYSGLGFTRGFSAVPKTKGYIDKITSIPVAQMVTGGMKGEQAIERGGRGLFTTYLLRALEGEADMDGDGYVTHSEIAAFIRPGVSNASGGRQTPQAGTLDGSGEVVFSIR